MRGFVRPDQRFSLGSPDVRGALTREEHLVWRKRPALEYVGAGDFGHAVPSMASDLKTHPCTDNPVLNGLARIDKAGFLAIDGIRNAKT